MNIVVVSLFDGLSGGRIALNRIEGINVLRYYSSEVDKYAIQIADKNHPYDTEFRLGDVKEIDFKKLKEEIIFEFGNDTKVMLIGGSPCQNFSMAGNKKGSSTKEGIDVTSLEQYLDLKQREFEFEGQSYLFWEFIRALKEMNPTYYFLENVKITKKWLPMFNETLENKGVLVDSSLVSAQIRKRYYWANLPKPNIINKEIILKDILEEKVDECMLIDFSSWNPILKKNYVQYDIKGKGHGSQDQRAYYLNGKHGTLPAKGGSSKVKVMVDENTARKLSPIECERLQNLDDNYTNGVSDNQRFMMIGNGWTIDVIVAFFKGLLSNK